MSTYLRSLFITLPLLALCTLQSCKSGGGDDDTSGVKAGSLRSSDSGDTAEVSGSEIETGAALSLVGAAADAPYDLTCSSSNYAYGRRFCGGYLNAPLGDYPVS